MRTFDVTASRAGDAIHLQLSGELDVATVRRAEEELARAEEESPPAIVIDLRSLSFMDSTGLRFVVEADRRARAAGRRLAIVQGPAPIRRVFEITRLDESLDVVADPAEL
ncbi:MAG: STAS domain-containing protein [Thermoleophilaceae bacterium]|nr:STAS domain-containing protein [Thermoleophilaceae bacterium]